MPIWDRGDSGQTIEYMAATSAALAPQLETVCPLCDDLLALSCGSGLQQGASLTQIAELPWFV